MITDVDDTRKNKQNISIFRFSPKSSVLLLVSDLNFYEDFHEKTMVSVNTGGITCMDQKGTRDSFHVLLVKLGTITRLWLR